MIHCLHSTLFTEAVMHNIEENTQNINVVPATDIFTPYIKHDMEMVKKWVKCELFEVVKFLHNGPSEDLARDSKIYKFFINYFLKHDLLLGLKALKDMPGMMGDNKLYLDRLWTDSIAEQVVLDGLSYRRSAVYAVMSNKFRGKNICEISS